MSPDRGRSDLSLERLASFLDARLETERFGDVRTVWRPSGRAVRRLGLALEPPRSEPQNLDALFDALFLHRPFRLGERWPGLGVLAAHAAFDAHLTTAHNPALAAALGLLDLEPVERDGVVVGMEGRLEPPLSWAAWLERVRAEFGGLEASLAHGVAVVSRVAVMSAMTAPLVTRAAGAGVSAYLPGQVRVPGRGPAAALGVGLVAVGHERSELWGLRRLGAELEAEFPGLETAVLS